ncbi:MAG TPA: hypothetical protein VK158_04775, partial [Acidobacteriota bacterium]|nr:hypothetical protein [Acidobacteriota bacterium]
MWPEEIALSCRLLERFTIRTCLNIGSEGKNYRHNRQPWNKNLDDFLEQRNVRVHTLDIDPQASPTYVADISEANAGLNIA